MKHLNLPNVLTLIRLIFSPLILPICLVYLLPYNIFWINICLALFFGALSLTDFLDGYIARKYNVETQLGKTMDPIADKFLVSSTLISLLAVQKIYFFWVIILIGREIFMMGLRQIALENKFTIPVSIYGKIKTTFQILMLIVIILNPDKNKDLLNSFWNISELFFIIITVVLSMFSAIKYYYLFQQELKNEI